MNESIMRSVWDESIRQSRQMLQAWTTEKIASAAKDVRTISLNVLAAIGFRRSFDFKSSTEEASETKEEKFSYRDALQVVLDNVILIMLIPRKHLRYSWLPAWMRRIGKAADDFGTYMQEMLDEELAALNRGEKEGGGLMTSMVRGLDMHQKDHTKGISINEIFGNLFVINFAGHDTTANTLAFAMLLLAAHPEVQDWVAEEVVHLTEGLEYADWEYNALFPKLLRCRTVMVSIHSRLGCRVRKTINTVCSSKRFDYTLPLCPFPKRLCSTRRIYALATALSRSLRMCTS
jgi:cytochrome P450